MHRKMSNSIPHLHFLHAISISQPHLWQLNEGAIGKCPLRWGAKSFPVENHWIAVITTISEHLLGHCVGALYTHHIHSWHQLLKASSITPILQMVKLNPQMLRKSPNIMQLVSVEDLNPELFDLEAHIHCSPLFSFAMICFKQSEKYKE